MRAEMLAALSLASECRVWHQTSVGSTGGSAGVVADSVAHPHLAAVDEGEVGGDVGVVGRQLELRLLLHAVRLGPRLNVLSPDILHACFKGQKGKLACFAAYCTAGPKPRCAQPPDSVRVHHWLRTNEGHTLCCMLSGRAQAPVC